MDVRISGGDVYTNASGETEYLSASEEAAQRVQIAASTPKGAFVYNRSLGTDYRSLRVDTQLCDQLDMLIREAAAGVADTQVQVSNADVENKSADIVIDHGGEITTVEVNLDGII